MASSNIFRILSCPYRAERDGFWGEASATLNFCEEDYAVSYYCAEIFNTISNVIFLWLGAKGIRNCIVNSHPPIFLASFIGYVFVGLGSIAFHTTMIYSMQLVDELSMIYATCLMCFATFSYDRSSRFQALLAAGLVVLASSITVYYYKTRDPGFHQTAYGLLTVTVVLRSMYMMEACLRPALARRNPARCRMLLRDMWMMVGAGVTTFLAGYLLWNLDTIYCGEARRWRQWTGLPWGVISEGHAWWHLLTGIGAYLLFVWGIWLRQCLVANENEYALVWPSYFTSIPEVLRRPHHPKTR